MNDITLRYGYGELRVPTDRIGRFRVLENHTASDQSREEIIRDALKHPIGTPRLREIAKSSDRVCIVISDITRYYQRMDLFLPALIDELTQAGVPDEQITILSATGAHDPQTEEDHALLLGEKLSERFCVKDHDCRDQDNLIFLGKSRNGTPICINRIAVECDCLVLTGAITEHDMAGYGGGRKSLLPGVASYESVAANHMKVFGELEGSGLRPECRIGNLEDNPMHQDMCDACELCPPDFLFNVILDSRGEYYQAVAGEWKKAFAAGVSYFNEACSVSIEEKADVVIAGCGGDPKDRDLYQASKGVGVCAEAVKEGGTILFAAQCPDGMGAKASVDIILDFDSNAKREEEQRKAFVPEAYSGYFLCQLAARYRVILVSDYPNEEELQRGGIELFRTLEEAILTVYGQENDPGSGNRKDPVEDLMTFIIPSAMSVVPRLHQQGET